MADDENERAERNKNLIARLIAPPTTAQVMAEIDLEIGDALELAVSAKLPTLVRLLRIAKLEVAQAKSTLKLKLNDKP